ncbi:MAG: Uncharacterized protein G01um1014106_487 [Parcubacteria group bacterium Gr01-1014_106]|nr:MAG: Uncharacterized protein G01um1014106_487 [Parcubacteria group bacterium Gr01-1014_106]
MRTVLSFQWGAPEHPQEDAFARDDEHRIFLVADGVTRTPSDTPYPNPSPAKSASDRLLEVTHRALLLLPRTSTAFREACRTGNTAVRQLNQELGFWGHTNYFENDLAGAVFSGVVLKETDFVWGFMTDCGVAHLSADGTILWMTEDRLTPVRKYFPATSNMRERYIRVRQEFRNRPENGMDRTFGAFTGEDTALPYLEVGQRSFTPGDVLLVFSDGMIHFVKSAEFRALLCAGSHDEIERFVSLPEHCDHKDDKTIIVIRT